MVKKQKKSKLAYLLAALIIFGSFGLNYFIISYSSYKKDILLAILSIVQLVCYVITIKIIIKKEKKHKHESETNK